jgi:foldase protein PrsA
MVDNIRQATLIWNELQKNPAGFERLAKEQSRDNSTKASGGMLPEPIARHANPRNVADPAFKQLVDGNPDDKDSKGNPIKPKDGAITGPIQVHEAAWVIIKREELIPARSGANFNDPHIQTLLMEQMKEVKQNDAVASLFNDLMRASRIENKLTGQIKLANEEEHPDYKQGLDQNVSRTTADSVGQMPMKSGKQVPEKVTPNKPITPAGVPGEAASAANQLQNTIKSAPPGSSTPPGN